MAILSWRTLSRRRLFSIPSHIHSALIPAEPFSRVWLFPGHGRHAIVLVNIYAMYRSASRSSFSEECILGARTACTHLPEWVRSRPCEANTTELTAVSLPSVADWWVSGTGRILDLTGWNEAPIIWQNAVWCLYSRVFSNALTEY